VHPCHHAYQLADPTPGEARPTIQRSPRLPSTGSNGVHQTTAAATERLWGSFGLSCAAEIRGTAPGAETIEPVPSYQIFDRLRCGWAMPKTSETAPGLVGS